MKLALFGSFANGDNSMASPAANLIRVFISRQKILSEKSRDPIFAIFDVSPEFRDNLDVGYRIAVNGI